MHGEASSRLPAAQGGQFTTTHWSVVLAAGRVESAQAREALEKLCQIYWYPLYVYVRGRGHSPEDAQDLTQEFFARFLQKEYFHLADPRRGRFRTFLLHALEHFLVNEWKRAQRAKRGGGSPCLSLDAEPVENRYSREAVTRLTPERAYEKRWARTLLEQVLAAVQQEYTQSGQGRLFEELSELLWGRDASVSYAQIGQRLGMSEGAIGTAMHRLRQRYGEKLRAEVAQTVAEPGEVGEELRYLLAVVSERD